MDRNAPVYERRLNPDPTDRGHEIRVLYLAPGPPCPTPQDQTGVVNGRLEMVRHLDAEYEALSYSWGPQDDLVQMQLNGNKTFHLSRHLEFALRNLRHQVDEVAIWIDFICLNQTDLIEKSHHLRVFPEIYKAATNVCIWLGMPTRPLFSRDMSAYEKENDELQATGHLEIARRSCCNNSAAFLVTSLRQREQARRGIEITQANARELADKGDLAWWNRLWCVPEFLSSAQPEILIGRERMAWFAFVRAMNRLGNNYNGCSSCEELCSGMKLELGKINKLEGIHTIEFSWPKMTDVGQWTGELFEQLDILLSFTRVLQCAEPHDHVYALLGIVSPKVQKLIRTDYSIPVGDVFTDVMRLFVTDNAHHLELFFGFPESVPGAPSWARDFSKGSKYEWDCAFRNWRLYLIEQADHFLDIQGRRFRGRGKIPRNSESPMCTREFFHRVAVSSSFSEYKGKAVSDRLIEFAGLRLGTVASVSPLVQGCSKPLDSDLVLRDFSPQELASLVRLTFSDGATIGVALDHDVRPGDIAFLFLGCYASFILRASTAEAGVYRIVSMCRISDIGCPCAREDREWLHDGIRAEYIKLE